MVNTSKIFPRSIQQRVGNCDYIERTQTVSWGFWKLCFCKVFSIVDSSLPDFLNCLVISAEVCSMVDSSGFGVVTIPITITNKGVQNILQNFFINKQRITNKRVSELFVPQSSSKNCKIQLNSFAFSCMLNTTQRDKKVKVEIPWISNPRKKWVLNLFVFLVSFRFQYSQISPASFAAWRPLIGKQWGSTWTTKVFKTYPF